MNRARQAADSDTTLSAYIAQRAAAFADESSQTAAIAGLQRVLAGDGVAPAEAAFLDRLRAAFR